MLKRILVALFAVLAIPAVAQDALPPMPPDAAAGAVPAAQLEWLRGARADTVICPFRGTIDYKPGEIECGLIEVPENREQPGSRSIELNYARIRAKGKDKDGDEIATRDDPVVYLTGGPGVGIDYYVKRLKDHRLVEQRDLYILEQRGIGHSTAFCPFFSTRNRAAWIRPDYVEAQRAQLAAMQACARSATAQGVDLRGYNTFENARDVRALRTALGFERWNVWGISYGSALGQAVLQVDPEGIKAMVLDGIVPIDIADLMRISRWYARDLDKLFAACAQQPACASAYPDQQRRFLAAIDAAHTQPFALTVTAGERYPDGKAHVFADVVAGIPFMLLYEQKQHPAIPAIIEGLIRAVETRDEALFKAIATADDDGFGGMSEGMAMAVHCQDGYVDQMVAGLATEQTEQPVLAAVFANPAVYADAVEQCAQAGMPRRDPAAYAPVQSDIPIVIANGAWDPVTPPPLAEYIMPGLRNGRLVEFPHAGHGPTRSLECGGAFLNAFYDDPAAPLDVDCVNEGEKAAVFVAPYFASTAVPRAAGLVDIDKKKLLPHAIWIGVSAFVVVLGFLVGASGWIARAINGSTRGSALGARWLSGLAAFAAVGHLAGLGIAAAMTYEITPVMLLFGLLGWARWFAWLAPLAGVLGMLAVPVALTSRGVPRASRIGFTLVALAAISVAAFAWWWDLWP